jgi:hypothetical protein
LLADPHAGRVAALGRPFWVYGTLIEAWSSMKSVQPKDRCGEPPADGRNGERYFQGERHSNETHALTTAPDAPCDKKADGQAAKLGHMGLA